MKKSIQISSLHFEMLLELAKKSRKKPEMELTDLDHKNFNSHVGKTFYILCPDDSNYYRTVHIKRNPFTNSLQPLISNPVYGSVEGLGIPAIHPLMLQRLSRIQPMSAF
jgi:hypothetical protein